MSRNRGAFLVTMVLCAFVALPGSAAAGNPSITVQLTIGESCIVGTGPEQADVIATLRTPEPEVRVRGRFETTSDPVGVWSGCFRPVINGGDSLRIKMGSEVKIVQIPQLTPRINRVADAIQGWAAPNGHVQILVRHMRGFNDVDTFSFSTDAGGTGRYRIDTSSTVNLKGFDEVVTRTFGGGVDLFARQIVPGMNAFHADNFVNGFINNGTNLHLRLTDQNGNFKAEVTSGPIFSGLFAVSMFRSDGSAAYPIGKDWLTANIASDAEIQMPVSNLRGQASTDMVWGRCPPNAKYALTVFSFSEQRSESFFGRGDANGDLVRDVGNRINLRRGDDLQLDCRYPTGDVWTDTDVSD